MSANTVEIFFFEKKIFSFFSDYCIFQTVFAEFIDYSNPKNSKKKFFSSLLYLLKSANTVEKIFFSSKKFCWNPVHLKTVFTDFSIYSSPKKIKKKILDYCSSKIYYNCGLFKLQ